MLKHLIWQRQQCAHILILIMQFPTGNVYCGTVPNVHVSIFLTKKKKLEATTPSIRFHFYQIIGRCSAHSRIPLKDKNICYMCKRESSRDKSKKRYTRIDLVMMETTIYDANIRYYIPAIQKLGFHLPHVPILGTNHRGEI